MLQVVTPDVRVFKMLQIALLVLLAHFQCIEHVKRRSRNFDSILKRGDQV